MSLLSAAARIALARIRATTTHVWSRDNSVSGFRCSCGRIMDAMCVVEGGYGKAEDIGDDACRLPCRDFIEPYLIRPGTDAEESDRIEALLADFGVDVETVARWWHPGWWSCSQCGSSGVTGFHACEAEL